MNEASSNVHSRVNDPQGWVIKAYTVPREIALIRSELSKILQPLRDQYKLLHASPVTTAVSVSVSDYDENKVSNEVLSIMKLLSASTEVEYAVSLLHTLFLDILQRESLAGQMLKQFLHAEFIKEKWVDVKLQYIAIGVIIVINLGALYYMALKGISRGSNWQRQFIYACILNWLSDVFLIQMADFLWCEFFLAWVIRKEVLMATKQIVGICDEWVEMLVQSHHDQGSKSPSSLLTRLHMPSHVLASYRPHVLESEIALRSTPSNLLPNKGSMIGHLFAKIPLEVHRTFSSISASMALALLVFSWYQLHYYTLYFMLPLILIVLCLIAFWSFDHKDILTLAKLPTSTVPISSISELIVEKQVQHDEKAITSEEFKAKEITHQPAEEKLTSGEITKQSKEENIQIASDSEDEISLSEETITASNSEHHLKTNITNVLDKSEEVASKSSQESSDMSLSSLSSSDLK